MSMQPCLFFRPEVHRLGLNRPFIFKIQLVMVSWVFDISNVGLLGCQKGLMWNERAQKVAPGLLWDIIPKVAA